MPAIFLFLLASLDVACMFEPEYIVVVNAFYPDGTSETKETIPSRGKVPVWNHLIEFDVTDRPVTYF